MKKLVSGKSLRLALLRDNKIEQIEIARNTGISKSKVNAEVLGNGPVKEDHRRQIYNYYANAVRNPVTFKEFWCRGIVLEGKLKK